MSSANKQSPLDFRLSCIIAPSYRYLRRRASHLKDQLRQNCIFPTLHLRLDGQFWLLRPSCWQDPSLERHNSASGPRSRRTWDLELYTPVSQQRVQVTPAEAQIHPPPHLPPPHCHRARSLQVPAHKLRADSRTHRAPSHVQLITVPPALNPRQ